MIKKKRVAALCKACRRLRSQTMSDNTQWIGDGCAMYILAGIEPMSWESLASMLDYTEKDIRSISYLESSVSEDLFSENNSTDVQVEAPPKCVIIKDREYLLFETETRLVFIDGRYLKPIDVDDQTTYFTRTFQDGHIALCVKKGFLPEAVILGVDFTEEKIDEWFDELSLIMTSVTEKYIPNIPHEDHHNDLGEQMILEGGKIHE